MKIAPLGSEVGEAPSQLLLPYTSDVFIKRDTLFLMKEYILHARDYIAARFACPTDVALDSYSTLCKAL